MAVSLNSVRVSAPTRPTIDMYYAPQGMGKTTLAAGAPNPVFIQTEDGLGNLQAPTFGLLKSYDEVVQAIQSLIRDKHDFNTVVLDSATWLEYLIWAKTCAENGWKNIEAPGYGKGPVAALGNWTTILEGLSMLRNQRGMGVIILGHATVKKQELPDSEDFERYQPSMHQRATDLIQQYVDDVFFINTRVSVTRSNLKDANSRGLGTGSAQRYVHTTLTPAHMAKNRWNMPDRIMLPMVKPGEEVNPTNMFVAVAQHIPYYRGLLQGTIQLPQASQPADDADSADAASPFANLGGSTDDTDNAENEASAESEAVKR